MDGLKMIKALARSITNMLSRGSVTLANAAGQMQTLQIALLSDEAKDGVEHFEPFGFTSNPHAGAEVLAAFIEGDRSHGIVIAATDRRYRIQNLAAGEVAIYDDHGAMIKLTQSGIIINGGGHPINISGAATVTVTGGDVIADGISLKTHKHGGVTAGAAQTGVPV
jgi:phage baseplate assembly protein V